MPEVSFHRSGDYTPVKRTMRVKPGHRTIAIIATWRIGFFAFKEPVLLLNVGSPRA